MTAASDLVIVGGGVVGSSTAYHAARLGLSVTVVERPRPGRASLAAAGGLWALGESVGLGCAVMLHKKALAAGAPLPAPMPESFRRFAQLSASMFPALAGELLASTGHDIEFDRTSLLFLLYDEGDLAYALSLPAHPAIERVEPGDLLRAEPALTSDLRGALRVHGDDQVHPIKLTEALQAGAQARGARFVDAEVNQVLVEAGRVRSIRTSTGDIPCGILVNAAGSWAGKLGTLAGLEIPVRPVRGQIVCTETLPPTLHACVSTTDCYLLQKRHGEILIGSTTEEVGYDAGVTPAAMRSLSAGAVRAVPSLASKIVKRVWSGFRPGTPDQLPILGPVVGLEGYLNACGHFRTGIVTAPLSGLVIAELAAGRSPSFPIDPFRLERFSRARG